MTRNLLAVALFLRIAFAAAPSVVKVEPPDWVVEPGGADLRLLITGTGLDGASVRGSLASGRVTVSPSGTHLFVDVRVPASARPGDYSLTIGTAAGTVSAPFRILPALAPAGRFQGFSGDDVLYLIMPDRFANGDPSNDDPPVSRGLYDRSKPRYYHGGDFAGIVQHLGYLKDLGVTTLWLTPVYDNVNHLNQREKYDNLPITDYHGYGAVDFYGVDEHLGTLDSFRELIDKAHALGLKVVQDQVANHTGPYHPWVDDPPTSTWFNGTAQKHLANTWQTWTLIDPHAPPALRKSTLDGWFLDILPDLNQDDPEVARYLIQNTLWWIARTGIDGIREDTVPYVPRRFWHDWTAAIHKRYPSFRVVGEVFDADPAMTSFFQGGRAQFDGVDSGIDSVFDFPLEAVLRRVFTGAAPAQDLAKLLAHDSLYENADALVTFLGLHDMQRYLNEQGAAPANLELAFTFLTTVRGIPMVYYGDEIGMQGGNDPDNRRDFPGGWNDDSRNAFTTAGRTPAQQEIFAHLRKVLGIRAALEPLRRGRLVSLYADDHAYVFARTSGAGCVLAAFNFAATAAELRVPLSDLPIRGGTVLRDQLGGGSAQAGEGSIVLRLPPGAAGIYR
jgi:glycosidase